MAIDFLQAQKKQRNMIIILIAVVCITLLVFWYGFLRQSAPPAPAAPSEKGGSPVQSKIEINFGVLEGAALEALQDFEGIPALKDEAGRENPFAPY